LPLFPFVGFLHPVQVALLASLAGVSVVFPSDIFSQDCYRPFLPIAFFCLFRSVKIYQGLFGRSLTLGNVQILVSTVSSQIKDCELIPEVL
jgi:hypothetical protein